MEGLVYHYIGSNLTPREKEGFQFGIYRGPNKRTPKKINSSGLL